MSSTHARGSPSIWQYELSSVAKGGRLAPAMSVRSTSPSATAYPHVTRAKCSYGENKPVVWPPTEPRRRFALELAAAASIRDETVSIATTGSDPAIDA